MTFSKATRYGAVALMLGIGGAALFGSCSGKSDKKDDDVDVGTPGGGNTPAPEQQPATSYVLSTVAEFPTCDGSRAGHLAFARDEDTFYACDPVAGAWNEVDIRGPKGPKGDSGGGSATGGITVYNSDDKAVGTLLDFQPPAIGMMLTDGTLGVFDQENGGFVRGYCSGDKSACGVDIGWSYGNTLAPLLRGNCLFSNTSCSGSCYFEHAPTKNSLFQRSASVFLKATGEEEQDGPKVILGVWDGPSASCVSFTSPLSVNAPYEIPVGQQVYTFPAGITYPLSPNGDLYLSK